MYLNSSWSYPFQEIAEKQNASQLVLTKSLLCSEETRYFLICNDQIQPMPARTQSVPHNLLTKPVLLKRSQKMQLNLCWPNTSHYRPDTNCISKCVDYTPPIPVRTQNVSQFELTKPISREREHKMYLNMCSLSARKQYISNLC
jgi:hypothetical protein